MAFGKADTGLIQADRAAQTMDPMLGVAAGIGNVLGGITKMVSDNEAAMQKVTAEGGKKWDKVMTDTMDGNNKLPRNQRRAVKKLYREGKKLYANADAADQDEIFDLYSGRINTLNQTGAAQNESAKNGDNYGPGFDNHDKAFSLLFSNGEYEEVMKNGVALTKIKNPEGYEVPGGDGYTYFTKDNLPISMDQWTDGSTAILANWNTEIKSNVKWDTKKTIEGYRTQYKNSITMGPDGKKRKINYFQGQDLITADHSEDGNDNSFFDMFTTGNMDPSYYKDINTTDGNNDYITVSRRGEGGEITQVKFDPSQGPMGGLTKEELTNYIKGKDSNGVKDYRNQSKLNEFITEKYSTYMGEVTLDAYNLEQEKQLKNSQRYFKKRNDNGDYEVMSNADGTFPSNKEVTTAKEKVLVESKFDIATSANMMSITGDGPKDVSQGKVEDWNQFTNWKQQLGEGGDLLGNLTKTYNYDDVDMSAENGVLTVAVGGEDAQGIVYDFTNPDLDKNDLMMKLENHLSESKFDNFKELTTLGDDSKTWNKTLSQNNKPILQQLGTEDQIQIKLRNMDRTSPEFATSVIDNSVNGIAMNEKDVLQALSTRSKVDKPFANKAEYKAWFMENNNGASASVDEAQFKDIWENYKIK